MNWSLMDTSLYNVTNLACQAACYNGFTRNLLNNSMNFSYIPCGMDLFLSPWTVLAQRKYDLFNNYNCGCFNFTNPMFGNFYAQPNLLNMWGLHNDDGANEPKTDEERLAKEQYTKLKELLSEYAKVLKDEDDVELRALASKITDTINKSDKKTYEEKFEELKTIYDTIDISKLNDFLITSNIKLKIDKKEQELSILLEKSGYENDEFSKKHSNSVMAIKDELNLLSDSNPTVSCLENFTEDNVLSLLSYYNSTNDKNLINFFMEKYNKLNPTSKDAVDNSLSYLTRALKIKANDLSNSKNLDDATKKALKNKIKDLDNTLSDGKIKGNFAAKFNELYAMARIASATVIEKGLTGIYGKIDENLGKGIVDETRMDLKSEKLNVDFETIIDDENSEGSDGVHGAENSDNLGNPFNSEIKVLENVGISQGEWSATCNVNAFSTSLKSATSKLRKYQADKGYTQEQWTAAYNGVINYYTNAYKALAAVRWNENVNESGDHNVDGFAGRSFKYKVNGKTYDESAQSYYKEHSDDDNVDSYDEIYDPNSESGTGLYIGCDYEWGKKNDFYIYVDQNALFEKFKEFLALV